MSWASCRRPIQRVLALSAGARRGSRTAGQHLRPIVPATQPCRPCPPRATVRNRREAARVSLGRHAQSGRWAQREKSFVAFAFPSASSSPTPARACAISTSGATPDVNRSRTAPSIRDRSSAGPKITRSSVIAINRSADALSRTWPTNASSGVTSGPVSTSHRCPFADRAAQSATMRRASLHEDGSAPLAS